MQLNTCEYKRPQRHKVLPEMCILQYPQQFVRAAWVAEITLSARTADYVILRSLVIDCREYTVIYLSTKSAYNTKSLSYVNSYMLSQNYMAL